MKRFIGLLTVAIIMLSGFSLSANAALEADAHIIINNEVVFFPDAQPFVDANGNVLFPLLFAGEKLGASAKWNASANVVTIKHSSDTIVITFAPDSGKDASVMLNSEKVSMDIAPFIKNNRTYVSMKFLSELFHCQIDWNTRIRTVFVTSAEYSPIVMDPTEQVTTTSEVLNIKSFDGYILSGKLDLPVDVSAVSTLVIFIPGTGPNTFDNHRLIGDIEFNYYDLFAQEFGKRQIGFFRYNTRGVEAGDQPPMYNTINMAEYKKYTPENQAKDIETMITELKKMQN